MSAYFHASISFSLCFVLSLSPFLSVCCRPCVCVFWRLLSDLPSLWRGVASALGHAGQLRRLLSRTGRKTMRNERMRPWGSRCGRQRMVSPLHPLTHTRMWLTHQHPLASRPPPVAAKARFSVKHRVCDAWELTTELGALRAQPDQNQLGPCTLAKKP